LYKLWIVQHFTFAITITIVNIIIIITVTIAGPGFGTFAGLAGRLATTKPAAAMPAAAAPGAAVASAIATAATSDGRWLDNPSGASCQLQQGRRHRKPHPDGEWAWRAEFRACALALGVAAGED